MSKPVVRGKFKFHDKEKDKKKKKKKGPNLEKTKKIFLKDDKKLRKRCECNHLDCDKNRTHLKAVKVGENGATVNYNKCKICGGMLVNDPLLMSEGSIKTAVDILYTVFSRFRLTFNTTPQIDKAITTTLFMNERALTLSRKMSMDIDKAKKNNKKNKKKKNKKNKKRYKARVAY